MAEDEALAAGAARVKFECERVGAGQALEEAEWVPLAQALQLSEDLGAAPVCADGRVGGNGALLCADGSVVVSKSGRFAGKKFGPEDFVRVLEFDCNSWTATFASPDSDAKPSSDTPILWAALVEAPKEFGWSSVPSFVLHGHSLASEDEAHALNLPCSPKETLFSTPDDRRALMDLIGQHPYPKHNIFIRKNHGFFMLAQSADEACRHFRETITRKP